MKKHFFFLLFSLFSFSTFAITVTWNVSSGYWDEPSNWDTGTLPGPNDVVIIPSGVVKLSEHYASIYQLTVEANATLLIAQNGGLEVFGTVNADGITVEGVLKNSGLIRVENTSSTANSFIDAIEVPGTLINYGEIEISQTYSKARGIFTTGEVYNKGEISSEGGSTSYHVYSQGYFYNGGSLTSHECTMAVFVVPWADGFFNDGSIVATDGLGGNYSSSCFANGFFDNGPNGSIVIVGEDVETGVRIGNDGEMINRGSIVILGPTDYGLRTQGDGKFENRNGASLDIFYGPETDLYNRGELKNYGNINLNDNDDISLHNRGDLYNGSTGYIYLHSIYNQSSADIVNDGTFDQMGSPSSNPGLENFGSIANLGCGVMELQLDIENQSNGNFYNKGLIVSKSTATHINNGSLDNYGILEDNPGTLYPLFTNHQVIGTELSGPIVNNTPVPNALVLNNLSHFSIDGWYDSQSLTTSAGTYYSSNNTFYPNAFAFWEPTLYVKATNLNTGCELVFEVDVSNTPFTGGGGNSALLINKNTVADASLSVFPNPNNGEFKVRLPELEEGHNELVLTDLTGKVILKKNQAANSSNLVEISPNDLLPNGVYFLRLSQNGQLLSTEKLVVKK